MDGVGAYAEKSGSGKDVLRCPTVVTKEPKGYGYAFNSQLAGKPLSKIANKAQTRAVYDSDNLKRNASDPVTSLPVPARHRNRPLRRGNSTVNIMGYADGHAKAIGGGQPSSTPGADSSQP